MGHTPKRLVTQAIKIINEVYGEELAKLIDWSADGDGYAINVEDLLGEYDAIDLSNNNTINEALPEGTFLEPINSASLRLVRA